MFDVPPHPSSVAGRSEDPEAAAERFPRSDPLRLLAHDPVLPVVDLAPFNSEDEKVDEDDASPFVRLLKRPDPGMCFEKSLLFVSADLVLRGRGNRPVTLVDLGFAPPLALEL